MKSYTLCRLVGGKVKETVKVYSIFDPFLMGSMLVKGYRLMIRVEKLGRPAIKTSVA